MSQQKALRQGRPLGSQEVTRLDELRGDEERAVYLRQAPARASEGTGLMLGLLPQPGGFLFPRCEDTPPHNQAVAMRPDVEEIALDEIVATTDARLFVNDTDDVVPGVDQLRELCLIARPAPEYVAKTSNRWSRPLPRLGR